MEIINERYAEVFELLDETLVEVVFRLLWVVDLWGVAVEVQVPGSY